MKLELSINITMDLNSEEYNLISRALRCQLKPEDLKKAEDLQNTMQTKRIMAFESYSKSMEKLKNNMNIKDQT